MQRKLTSVLFQVSALASLTTFGWVTSLSLILLVMAHFIGSGAAADRPGAFVWRAAGDDPDLSKAVGELLESSARNFTVKYVAPEDITPSSLQTVQLFAFPGGPGMLLRFSLAISSVLSIVCFFCSYQCTSTPCKSRYPRDAYANGKFVRDQGPLRQEVAPRIVPAPETHFHVLPR